MPAQITHTVRLRLGSPRTFSLVITPGQDQQVDLVIKDADNADLVLEGWAFILSVVSPDGLHSLNREATAVADGQASLPIVSADTTGWPEGIYSVDVWAADPDGLWSQVGKASRVPVLRAVYVAGDDVTVPESQAPLATGQQGEQGIQGVQGEPTGIQRNGVAFTQRAALNFSLNFSVEDDEGDDRINVGLDLSAVDQDIQFTMAPSGAPDRYITIADSIDGAAGTNLNIAAGKGDTNGVNGAFGGYCTIRSGKGGDALAGGLPGAGGELTLRGGDAGAVSDGDGATGGNVILQGGIGTVVSGQHGGIFIGEFTTDEIRIGHLPVVNLNQGNIRHTGHFAVSLRSLVAGGDGYSIRFQFSNGGYTEETATTKTGNQGGGICHLIDAAPAPDGTASVGTHLMFRAGPGTTVPDSQGTIGGTLSLEAGPGGAGGVATYAGPGGNLKLRAGASGASGGQGRYYGGVAYLDGGDSSSLGLYGDIRLGTLTTNQVFIGRSDGALSFYGHAAAVRPAAYNLNAGGTSRNLPAVPTTQECADVLRQWLADAQGNGLAA